VRRRHHIVHTNWEAPRSRVRNRTPASSGRSPLCCGAVQAQRVRRRRPADDHPAPARDGRAKACSGQQLGAKVSPSRVGRLLNAATRCIPQDRYREWMRRRTNQTPACYATSVGTACAFTSRRIDDDLDIVREDHVDMAVVGVGRLEGRRSCRRARTASVTVWPTVRPSQAASRLSSSWVSTSMRTLVLGMQLGRQLGGGR